MQLFDLDPATARDEYRQRGWLHAAGGVSDEFLAHLTETIDARIAAGELQGPGLAGAKQQFLFDFPPEMDLQTQLFVPVAEIFGLDPERITLSERHLKHYDLDADPDPLPHKDRLASTVSLGITIRAPEGTRAFLHLDEQQDVNPFMAPHLLGSLRDDVHPATALADSAAVEIRDQPGDVLGFAGSSVWHGRRDAAGAMLLYLKFNDFGADPLGEDPRTTHRVATSRLLLSDLPDEATVSLGPRIASIDERQVPPSWEPMTVVSVWDRNPLWISELEANVVRHAASAPSLGKLVADLGDRAPVLAAVRRLVEAEVLLLSR